MIAPQSEPVTESYLESLSDLLVGLLFIFIIVLMSFSLDLRVSEAKNKERLKQLSDATELRTSMLDNMQSTLKRSNIFVEIDRQNGILRLPQSMLFDSGSAEFTRDGLSKVAQVAKILANELPCYALVTRARPHCPVDAHPVLDAVFIEGHTDKVPITGGPFKNNWDLSAARSRTTYLALTSDQPVLNKILNSNAQPLLSISSYGDSRPLSTYGSEAENQKRSRRIDLRFIVGTPKLANHP